MIRSVDSHVGKPGLHFNARVSENTTIQTPPATIRFAGADAFEPDSVRFNVLRNRTILNLRQWLPPGKTRDDLPKKGPVILLVHGLSGRTSWMTPLVERLMAEQKDKLFYGLDIPTIGQNSFAEGHIRNGDELVQQVREAIEHLGETHEGPVVAIGLSLGGLLVSKVAVDPPESLTRISLISPGWKPARHISDPKMLAGRLWDISKRRAKGLFSTQRDTPQALPYWRAGFRKKKVSKRDPNAGLTPLQRQIELEKLEAKDSVQALTTQSYIEILKMMLGFWKDARKIELPVRLYVTESDDVVDPQAMLRRYAKFNSKDGDKLCMVFGDGKHDLLMEGEALDAMAYSLNRWLTDLKMPAEE